MELIRLKSTFKKKFKQSQEIFFKVLILAFRVIVQPHIFCYTIISFSEHCAAEAGGLDRVIAQKKIESQKMLQNYDF